MYIIKALGLYPELTFTDPAAVLAHLSMLPNNHLSVHRKLSGGTFRVFYVSVDQDGVVRETYGDQDSVTETMLLAA